MVRPDPGRAVVPVAGSDEAVLVYDEGLELEPQLIKLTAAAASMALEHARLQAEVQAQLEQVRRLPGPDRGGRGRRAAPAGTRPA